ncbi:MAG: HAD family hydrolase [Anaerolineales bacterium]
MATLILLFGVLRHPDIICGSKCYLHTIGRQVVYNQHMFPAIFLDRDGVIIENRADYVRDWSQVVLLPEAVDALSRFRNTQYKIVLVTNQSAVGRGLISLKTAEEINQRLARVIEEHGGRLDAVYMCPHAPNDQCDCRKPQAGLFLQAAHDLSLDLNSSWMVGDAWSDLLAGQNANLQGLILVKTGRGVDQLQQPKPENLREYLVLDDLSSALASIINTDGFKDPNHPGY